jgi:hypothetical protein
LKVDAAGLLADRLAGLASGGDLIHPGGDGRRVVGPTFEQARREDQVPGRRPGRSRR